MANAHEADVTRSTLGRLVLVLALLLPFYFAGAALGARFGIFDWRFSLGTLIVVWGPRLIIGVLVMALLSLAAALAKSPRKGWKSALVALLISSGAMGYLVMMRHQSQSVPAIHDVSTRPADPPRFSATLLGRRAATPDVNPVVSLTVPLSTLDKYQGPRFADIADQTLGQVATEAYPAVRPLTSDAPAGVAYAAALAQAKAQGWTIVSQDQALGTFDATATTFWFGFQDDVAVRVRPQGSGSVIDVRSTSRVGLSDLGANAARITDFLSGVSARL